MKRPQFAGSYTQATPAQLDELVRLAKTKTTFSTEQYVLLEEVLGTFVYVMLALQNARVSIKRFRQMLLGVRTESKGNVLKDHAAAGDPANAASDPPVAGDATPAEGDPDARPSPL